MWITDKVRCPVSGELIHFVHYPPGYADLYEEISAENGISILGLIKMVRKIVSDIFDPIPFEERTTTFEVKGSPPADPYVDCDVVGAWYCAREAAKRNDELLRSRDLSLRAALDILFETIRWARFWSVRCPEAEWRERFAKEVGEGEAQIAEIEAAILKKFNVETN